MALRRTRIKGIANIPPRKKPTPSVDVSLEDKLKLDQGGNEATSCRSDRELKHEEAADLSNKDHKFIGNSLETCALDCEFDTNKGTIKSDLKPEASNSSDKLKHLTSSETIEKSININLQNSNTTTENKTVSKPVEPAEVKSFVRRKFLKPKVNLKFKNNDRNVATESGVSEEVPITEIILSSSNIESELEDLNEHSLTTTMTENETVLMPDEPADLKPIFRRKFLKPKVNLNFKNKTRNVTDSDKEILEKVPIITEVPTPSKLDLNDHSTITSENETISKPNESAEVNPIVRRKFLKPKVNLNFKNNIRNAAVGESSISKEISITEESPSFTKIESNTLKDSNNKVIVLSEIRILSNEVAKFNSETANNAPMPNADPMLNEAQLNSNEILQEKSSSVIFPPHKRCISESQASDSEYPAPPPSPSKINRSRIKAIPKLSFRKASCSASESEDETRKYGRIRNNSVCSVASTSTHLEPATPTLESIPSKETPMLPKKLIKTEQSKKLAEAKKDFQRRFGANTPDKQKLRMIDLIYYNPETNPMSQQKSNNDKSETNKKEINEISDEEQVDDPIIEGQKENDTDNMPVPQIKIGPSGEIILDEQSLIVENAELAKQKEKIFNSSVVDGDFDTGYGIYKRAQRTVKWTQKETLRFYKALNLIGTDFTTMTELFPRRTRRELKLKFKKEEKTNRHLIDKAILQPCTYNYTDFKREMQIEEEEEAFLIKLRNEECERRKQKKIENLKEKATKKEKKSKSKGTLELSNEIADQETKAKKPKAKRKKKLLSIDSVLEDSEEDGDISDSIQSDTDEEEIIPFLKPTRSGRIPKGTIKFTDPPEEFYKLPKKRFYKRFDSRELKAFLEAETTVTNAQVLMLDHATQNCSITISSGVESNSEPLVPGSVVITTEEALDNELEYKVFMVTPDKKMVPLQLESSIIERLVKEGRSAELPLNPEQNVTIPSNEANLVKDNGE